MPIRAHLPPTSTFDPEAIVAMSKAFEDACAALHVVADDERGRETIASRIISLARSGETDADMMTGRVVAEVKATPAPLR